MIYTTETRTYQTDSDGYLINAPVGCYAHDDGEESTHGHPDCLETPQDLIAAEKTGAIVREYDRGNGWRLRVLPEDEKERRAAAEYQDAVRNNELDAWDEAEEREQAEALAAARDEETERNEELWEAAAVARHNDELERMARDDENRAAQF